MSGAGFGKRSSRRGAALCVAAIAAAVAVLAAGALLLPQQGREAASDGGASAAAPSQGRAGAARQDAGASSSAAAPVDVVGAESVAAVKADAEGFARAFAAYLGSTGARARSAAVVADPDDPDGPSFYANAGGLWYRCEATGGASGWAFAPAGEESPFAPAEADDPVARGARPVEGSSREAGAAQAAQDQAGGSEWVAMSDPVALSRTVGVDAASQLPEAVAGYAASKGIGCDPASARVDASSVRSEGAGVGFVVDTGPARLDVVYADGGYGFKIL